MQLVSKFSNLCVPDPYNVTDGRTDRRTDDMRSQDGALHYNNNNNNNTFVERHSAVASEALVHRAVMSVLACTIPVCLLCHF